MKISFWGQLLEISDWSKKLKVVTLIIAMITLFSVGLTLFAGVTIPGLTPIAMGMVMLLLGIKEFNVYFKEKGQKLHLILGVILTVIYGLNLYTGIIQINTAVFRVLRL